MAGYCSSEFVSFNARIRAVLIAHRIAHENNIFQAHKLHAWSILYGTGIVAQRGTETLENFNETILSFYVRFAREATHSLLSHGYFAYVYTKLQPHGCDFKVTVPTVLAPNIYFIISQRVLEHEFPALVGQGRIRGGYHVIFIRKEDETMYGHAQPYVEDPPDDYDGRLSCPAAKIYDMHDFCATHNQLHMVEANINVTPKAWTSHKDDTRSGLVTGDRWADLTGVRAGLSDMPDYIVEDAVASEAAMVQARRQIDDVEAMRADQKKPAVPGLAAFTTRSRTMDICSSKDPTSLYPLPSNTTIIPVPAVSSSHDIVAYTQMQDRRIAVTLGLPLGIVGLGSHTGQEGIWSMIAYKQYKRQLAPLRQQINTSLVNIITDLFEKGSKKAFLKSQDPYYLQGVTIQLVPTLDTLEFQQIVPFLKKEAAAKHLATIYSMQSDEFDLERIIQNSDINKVETEEEEAPNARKRKADV